MTLKRALLVLALVIPPTLGLTAATVMGRVTYELSLKGALSFFGVFAAWGIVVGLTGAAARAKKGRRPETAAPVREAPEPRAGVPYLVPQPLESFVGREEEIQRLERGLKPGRVPVITGVVGVEGTGKTELAKAVAHRVADRYRDGVLWADCAHQELDSIADLWAAEYGVVLPDDDLVTKAAAWRGFITEKEVLLVFDDVQPGQRIEALLPAPSLNMVLITTQNESAHILQAVAPVRIDRFSEDEAIGLAANVLGREKVEAQWGAAKQFFELVGHLPLALSIGLYTARERGWGLVELSRALERAGAVRAQGEPELSKSIEAVLQTAWHSLPSDLQRAFATVAVFNQGPSFDTKAMAAALDAEGPQAREVLGRLVEWSLLTEVEEDRWTLHPLLHEFVAARLPADDVAWGRMAAHYAQVASAADGLYLQGGEALLRGLSLFDLAWPHIRAGQGWAAARGASTGGSASPGWRLQCERPGIWRTGRRRATTWPTWGARTPSWGRWSTQSSISSRHWR
jgi:hypothetical protein